MSKGRGVLRVRGLLRGKGRGDATCSTSTLVSVCPSSFALPSRVRGLFKGVGERAWSRLKEDVVHCVFIGRKREGMVKGWMSCGKNAMLNVEIRFLLFIYFSVFLFLSLFFFFFFFFFFFLQRKKYGQ